MKRSVILFLLVFLLLSNFVCAVSVENVKDNLDERVDVVEEFMDNPEESSRDYLQTEWRMILEKRGFGKVLLIISDFLKNLNPVFNLILGVEYSLSWMFFLCLFFWIVVFLMVFFAIKAIFVTSDILNFAAGFLVPFILAQFKLFVKFVDFISPLLKDTKIVLLTLLVVALLLSFYIRLMQSLEKYTKKTLEQEKKFKEKLREDLEYELKKARSEIKV